MAETAASNYVVLRMVASTDPDYPECWVVLKTVPGRSQEEAIKAAADGTVAATYAAIPVRSWAPLRIAPKTVTTFEVVSAGPQAPVPAAPAAGVAS